ncbi:NUDIX domain-containing protein [Agromyces atrinae]|uniref:NUDIX domain-containing protein n=1 Tax=Agromyces atrinae TaxID=592376 RepID=A0A4Q2M4Q0_9MICO|nr:NUDIX domain-containing protein [Agromyces atrinae]NYD67343.1 nudix-type nucleoside diphosphatase (YffH/AdpP family) [Agromyces atrinae]RXZ86828.1 NUDIX domain-containing protein [Agromyces atrinae]
MTRAGVPSAEVSGAGLPGAGLPGAGLPGADVPDRRGRTGLDRVGLDLTGNPRVRVRDVRLLTSNWYVTRVTQLDYQRADGTWTEQERETYDRGNGACVLLYDRSARTVLLTRQFRYPAYVNGHPDGNLIETPAGLLDDDEPLAAIRREAEEETGYAIGEVEHVFDVYMSPGSVTEMLHFYAAPFDADVRASVGGGLEDEGEEIEVLIVDIDDALARIGVDIIDAKTIMLLQWAALTGPFAR